jgi:hypothetical protein
MIYEVRSSLGVAIDDCPVRDNWVVEIILTPYVPMERVQTLFSCYKPGVPRGTVLCFATVNNVSYLRARFFWIYYGQPAEEEAILMG